MNKICLQCGIVFEKAINETVKVFVTRHKYCSKKCYILNMKGKKPPQLAGANNGRVPVNKGKKFPERSGEHNPRFTRSRNVCQECLREFEVQAYRKNDAKFCSKACACKNRNLGISAENEKQRKSAAYKKWRQCVFARDNWTCQICNCRGGYLHADHIKPFAKFPALRLDVNNGRTLCEDCHKNTPTFGRRRTITKIFTA